MSFSRSSITYQTRSNSAPPPIIDYSRLPKLGPTQGENVLVSGAPSAPILVICDAPSRVAYEANKPINDAPLVRFWEAAEPRGFKIGDFRFITPCPPLSEYVSGSVAREREYLQEYREEFRKALYASKPKVIVHLGVLSAHQLLERTVQITKVRGLVRYYSKVFDGKVPVMGMLSPGQVLRQPGYSDQFSVDFDSLMRLRKHGWDAAKAELSARNTKYQWVDSFELTLAWEEARHRAGAGNPVAVSWDTETIGGSWRDGAVPITVQMSFDPGVSYAIIVHWSYMLKRWAEDRGKPYSPKELLVEQKRAKEHAEHNLKAVAGILLHPDCRYSGHNLKYDLHVMHNAGVKVPVDQWAHDTMQLAFCANENIVSKDLANCVKLWVPAMAGYSDEFDAAVDKSDMLSVSPTQMLPYAAGDADAVCRLTRNLLEVVDADAKQANCYDRVQMPALRMFFNVERHGIQIDRQALRAFSVELEAEEKKLYKWLISKVAPEIRELHFGRKGEGLKFSRAKFLIDILFTHPKGFRFKPKMWTDGSAGLPEAERIPSTSSNKHLPYFEDEPWVATLMQYQELAKMRSTYVGEEFCPKTNGPTGMWQYLTMEGTIHPSYFLHRTVTGRAASADPNGQNFPKRGALAKAYRKIFVARPGYEFVEVDLSQAELRVAAWAANEQTMIKLYREGADIHAATAAAVSNNSNAAFAKLPEKEREHLRQQAKAVNFGFLYGMGWRKFASYAKVSYGVEVTDEAAKTMRDRFFNLYPGLREWHRKVREFVRANGYVRARHGAKRNLQDIRSVDEGVRAMAERQAINSPVQRLGSDIALMGACRFARDCSPTLARVVAFIHDAVIVEVRKPRVLEVAQALKFYMESVPFQAWFGVVPPLPILSDVAIGPNLRDMKKMPEAKAVQPTWYNAAADLA